MATKFPIFLLLLSVISAPPGLVAADFSIDTKASQVVIRVYRAGILKGFGHNHIVSTSTINGQISYDPGHANDARFSLTLPVSSFEIDNRQLRAQAGEQFSAEVDDSAREGTRKNMLGKKVLQARRFPEVSIASGLITRTWSQRYDVELNISIRGVTHTLIVPVELSEDGDTLIASSSFSLAQSDFGITPLKAALGSIAVGDNLDIDARIVARKTGIDQK